MGVWESSEWTNASVSQPEETTFISKGGKSQFFTENRSWKGLHIKSLLPVLQSIQSWAALTYSLLLVWLGLWTFPHLMYLCYFFLFYCTYKNSKQGYCWAPTGDVNHNQNCRYIATNITLDVLKGHYLWVLWHNTPPPLLCVYSHQTYSHKLLLFLYNDSLMS